MDYNQIKSLLDKYWEGETSLSEEAQIRAYFSHGEVAEDLQALQPLFVHFKTEQDLQLADDFDSKLLAKLDEKEPHSAPRFQLRQWGARAAAIALLVFAAFFLYQQTMPPAPQQQAVDWSRYEADTPEQALEQVKAALLLVSRKMNKGRDKAAAGVSKIESVTRIIK